MNLEILPPWILRHLIGVYTVCSGLSVQVLIENMILREPVHVCEGLAWGNTKSCATVKVV